MAVPTVAVLSIAQPVTATGPETVAPSAGESMCTLGRGGIWNEILQVPESGFVSLSVAETANKCVPGLSVAVFKVYVKPTFGQPGRPM
jgi:hypothetical protein